MSSDSTSAQRGYVVLSLEVIDEMMGADIMLAAVCEDIRHGKFRRAEGVVDVTQSINGEISRLDNQNSLYHAVGSLMNKLEVFRQVMDTLSEVSR